MWPSSVLDLPVAMLSVRGQGCPTAAHSTSTADFCLLTHCHMNYSTALPAASGCNQQLSIKCILQTHCGFWKSKPGSLTYLPHFTGHLETLNSYHKDVTR